MSSLKYRKKYGLDGAYDEELQWLEELESSIILLDFEIVTLGIEKDNKFRDGFNEGAKWARKMCVERLEKHLKLQDNDLTYLCGLEEAIHLIKQLDHLESRPEESSDA